MAMDKNQSFQDHGTSQDAHIPALSVIIPVYNVERYLDQCLSSVLNQTFHDFEVLCINDGSTDTSLEILKRYAAADARVAIISKQNSGYGNSVNLGISSAHGTYISIIEPDDYIDSHMFADLLAQATFGGSPADIVKSSYWNYYDGADGTAPHIEKPNLMNKMPRTRMRFTVHQQWEVLYHHPSIWSAIYRRDFLQRNSIRLIEPQGAGWADNPFFFETMLRASSIVWIPAAYYYYRQTNPESSSYLKDYHLPFDRLRDIHDILDRLNEQDPHILICFYNRCFSYIRSVLEKFNYSEQNPELFSCITEVLGWMDENVLFAARSGMRQSNLAYYNDVMGRSVARFKPHHASSRPRLAFVVPMHDSRPYLWRCLQALAMQTEQDVEVVCIDLGSRDRSLSIAQQVAERDHRFSVVSCSDNTLSSVLNALQTTVHAARICFVDPRLIPTKHHAEAVLSAFAQTGATALVLQAKVAHWPQVQKQCVAVQKTDLSASMADIGASASNLAISAALLAKMRSSTVASYPYHYAIFSLLAVHQAQNIAFAALPLPTAKRYEPIQSPLALLNRTSATEHSRLAAVQRIFITWYDQVKSSSVLCEQLRNAALDLIAYDMAELSDVDDLQAYCDGPLQAVWDTLRLYDASPLAYSRTDFFQTLCTIMTSDAAQRGRAIIAYRAERTKPHKGMRHVLRTRLIAALPSPVLKTIRQHRS